MDAIDLHTLLYGPPQNVMSLRQDDMMNLALSKIASSAQLTFSPFHLRTLLSAQEALRHPVHFASLSPSVPLSFFFICSTDRFQCLHSH